MDIIRIAICDDDTEYIEIVEKYLDRLEHRKIEVDVFYSGESLVFAYKNGGDRYDVIFLDMEMAQLNGIDTANIIRDLDEHVVIVFVTSYTEYMRESFQCSPFRFLVKPLGEEEFLKVWTAILERFSKKRKVLTFMENKAMYRLLCEDIIYCESFDHLVYIHTLEEVYKLRCSLSNLYSKLDNSLLFRVHSSFIVNFHFVKIIRNSFIELYDCDKRIPIGRTYKKTVLSEYTDYIERTLYI